MCSCRAHVSCSALLDRGPSGCIEGLGCATSHCSWKDIMRVLHWLLVRLHMQRVLRDVLSVGQSFGCHDAARQPSSAAAGRGEVE